MKIKLLGLIAIVVVLGTSCKKDNETAPQIDAKIVNPNHKTATDPEGDGPSQTPPPKNR